MNFYYSCNMVVFGGVASWGRRNWNRTYLVLVQFIYNYESRFVNHTESRFRHISMILR